MKQNNVEMKKIWGWALFLFTIVFFSVQMGFLFLHSRYNVEYSDNRIFYMINIFIVICLSIAVLLLVTLTKMWKWFGACIIVIFTIVNIVLLFKSNHQIKNIVRISPDFKHVLSIKENTKTGEAIYYRTYYGILARPKESLPYKTVGAFKVKWLAKDISAVTYKASDHSIHQYIGTYGDRGGRHSYYYVGAELHGQWRSENAEVISNTEGITVVNNGEVEKFDWENIVQFGTLAVVLMKNNQAVWTISLNENFEVHSAASMPPSGEISLYKATMENNEPITLHYVASN
ncbi:hypothetical protein ACQKP0_15180 [Heyndrickxia sp. NPDC080065]|uniref:hypothetical protein n=1 Tax=Heyndrickxia sp. NPDC080065 TaxID=3390568 RepID=UPI003D08B74E